MALTRKYDNGPNGWTDYDSSGNAVASGTSGGYSAGHSSGDYARPNASYVTNEKGQVSSQYTQGNATYGVGVNSVFDPLGKNYNPLVANSKGNITLSDLDSSTGNGLRANYNGIAGIGGTTGGNSPNPSYGGMPGGSPQPTNNTAFINQQNDTALQSTIAAIKAAVQQAKAKQQTIIDKTAPEQYGNLKNVVYGQSLAALPGMRENTANLGASEQGGYSRTTETRANSELMNRLGELDRQKQSVIDQANFTIADLESQGMINEANATKESALAKLQQIVAESSRLDSLNSSNYWNAEQMSQNNYWKNVNQSNYQQQTSTANTQQEKENEYRNATLALQQQAQTWQQQFQQQGYTADEAYRQAQLKLQQETLNLDNQYKYSALAASQAKANTPKGPTVTELNYQDKQNAQKATAQAMAKLQEKADQGWTRDQVLNWMYANSQSFIGAGVDMDNLAKLASSAYTWNGSDSEGSALSSRYK